MAVLHYVQPAKAVIESTAPWYFRAVDSGWLGAGQDWQDPSSSDNI